jgi:hypothetical protein
MPIVPPFPEEPRSTAESVEVELGVSMVEVGESIDSVVSMVDIADVLEDKAIFSVVVVDVAVELDDEALVSVVVSMVD